MTTPQQIIGSCIRLFREEQKLSLEKLSLLSGISYQYLSGIENGHENFTIGVLNSICNSLNIPLKTLINISFDYAEGQFAPTINPNFFRKNIPLPDGLTYKNIEDALNSTQHVIYKINRNMMNETKTYLQEIIQGNNFSGLISNILGNSFDLCSTYKHNHHQRYPDLISNTPPYTGLEVKVTKNIGKGGESHNGHEGWHLIACYKILEDGNILFIHVMIAYLNDHRHQYPDWKYLGSKTNELSGSRRTETFNTTLQGLTKLRDGSIYLDPNEINYSRWRQDPTRAIPPWSIWS